MDAQQLFERIGTGKEHAVSRPSDAYTDRKLRKLIEVSNRNTDCIISGKYGYYRPDVNRPDEVYEANKVIAQELHRARAILHKRLGMKLALAEWEDVECQRIAGIKGQQEKGSLQKSLEDMAMSAGEDNNTVVRMAMRMLSGSKESTSNAKE